MLEYWYQALRSPFGIEIIASDPDKIKQKLYAVRKEAADPDLHKITIRVPPNKPGVLWLIKNGKTDAKA